MKILCDTCNRKFDKPESHIQRTKNNFCSTFCHNIFQANKLTKLCKFCTQPFLVRPSEYKKVVTCPSKECRYQNKKGKNNPNYRHGQTKPRKISMASKKYKNWRQEILIRDNYTCLFCGFYSKTGLHVDHIQPWSFFPSLRYVTSNGRTLCKNCHKNTYKDTFLWRDILTPHILVDLDGTLAYYDSWVNAEDIGRPIMPMVNKVKSFLKAGKKVVIFTARVTETYDGKELSAKELFDIENSIKQWCEQHIGQRLLVTNKKTIYAEAIYDDRGIGVEVNTGRVIGSNLIRTFNY